MFIDPHRSTTTLALLLLFLIVDPLKASEMNASTLLLTLESPAHFTLANGSDIVIKPGTYHVEAADPWLRLIPGERKQTFLLKATPTHHDEHVSRPIVNLLPEKGHAIIIQVLLPDGHGLEAEGSTSEIRSRAVKQAKQVTPPTKPKTVLRRQTKKNPQAHSPENTIQQLEKQVQDLQKIAHALQSRLSKLESAMQVGQTGITLNSSAKITLNASMVEVSGGMVKVNSGMSKFTGVVQSDSVVTNSVISSSYTPGAGNVW
ncbi:MAG: hypothetical protein MRJ96_08295 [Nitrospirales bacterium]|nr:hypothetical protein [Nitrospira sp.]MDR4501432.1 hypothetical protein [Nitrospirales bacterium]